MSKIMQQLYAEARAAREAAASVKERPTGNIEGAAQNPASPSSIEWWKARYEQAGRAAASKVKVATTAIEREHSDAESAPNPASSSSIEWWKAHFENPTLSPRELIDWWTRPRDLKA